MNARHNTLVRGLQALVGLLTCAFPAVGAADSVLYAIDNESPYLSVVNPVTGVEQSYIQITIAGESINRSNGLAVDPTTNKMYAAIKLNSVGGPGRNLVEIDPTTGVGTNIGNMGDAIASLAFGSDGTLYAVTGDGAATPETMYTVNLGNGNLTFFKTLGNGDDGEAIAFNPVDGMMYHMSGRGTGLIFEKINLTTGAITNIPLSGGSYVNPNLEAIGFTFDSEQNLFVGSLIECGCEGGLWSYITLTPNGFLTHTNTLQYWWKDYAFYETGGAGDVFIDLEAIPDVGGAVDSAVLVSGLPGGGRSPSIKLYVKDAATGMSISHKRVLTDNWYAVDMAVAPTGGGNALLAVLARRANGKNLIAVHRADNGKEIRRIEFFNNNWVASAVAYVPMAEGPGTSAFAVVAQNNDDNRVAVQLRRRSDGSLIHTIAYFGGAWEPIDVAVLDDLNGNDLPEIALLGRSNAGKTLAVVKDASSKELINKIQYFSNSVTPRALAVVDDVGAGPAPGLGVLGVKPDGSNTMQLRDALSDDVLKGIYYFGSHWTTLGLAGLADVNGNSSGDAAVLAQHDTKGTIRADVRDAVSGQLIKRIKFLGPNWDARDFAAFPDIDGGGVQELGVVAHKADGSIRVQIRNASDGSIIKSFNIP